MMPPAGPAGGGGETAGREGRRHHMARQYPEHAAHNGTDTVRHHGALTPAHRAAGNAALDGWFFVSTVFVVWGESL